MNTSMKSAFAGTQLGAPANGSRVNMLFKRVGARTLQCPRGRHRLQDGVQLADGSVPGAG